MRNKGRWLDFRNTRRVSDNIWAMGERWDLWKILVQPKRNCSLPVYCVNDGLSASVATAAVISVIIEKQGLHPRGKPNHVPERTDAALRSHASFGVYIIALESNWNSI
jgi:hypothetical protein